MNTGKMRTSDDSNPSGAPVMLVAIEMGLKSWRLAMAVSGTNKHRQVAIEAGHYLALSEALAQARERLGLPAGSAVIFCYEAGREGFHPYRVLSAAGPTVWVVDSGSIEVNRRQRRAKNDALDAAGLLGLMQRQYRGERALHVVHVPTPSEEDLRQRTRERDELKVERGRLRVRMQSLLFAQGVRDFPKSVRQIEHWLQERLDSVPRHLSERLAHEFERLRLVDAQLKALDQAQHARRRRAAAGALAMERPAQQLCQLKGIGERSACLLSSELFGWRRFNNRREVGALVGLVPTPYDSGDSRREQGISKAGNKRVRRVIIEVAWKWLDYQPDSALARWFVERFAHGRRARRIGIVALARRLLVAFWHYLEHGVIPAGALLKA